MYIPDFHRQTIPVVGGMVAECLLLPVLLDAFQMYVLFVSSVVAVDVRESLRRSTTYVMYKIV